MFVCVCVCVVVRVRITAGAGRLSDLERMCADGSEDSDCDDGSDPPSYAEVGAWGRGSSGNDSKSSLRKVGGGGGGSGGGVSFSPGTTAGRVGWTPGGGGGGGGGGGIAAGEMKSDSVSGEGFGSVGWGGGG